jgi:WD40 repeat protein
VPIGSFSARPTERRWYFVSRHLTDRTSICSVAATGGSVIRLFRPARASGDGLWQFEVNWRRGLIIADTHGPSGWKLWRMDLRGRGARIIRSSDDVQDFAVSPDGTRVACEHRGGIWLLDVDRRVMRPLLAKGGQPAWSPDGKRIAFMNGDTALGVIDVSSRKQSRLVWGEGSRAPRYNRGWALAPSWSPDGRLLWFTVTASKEARVAQGTIDHRVGIVDFAEKAVWMRSGYWRSVSWAPQK